MLKCTLDICVHCIRTPLTLGVYAALRLTEDASHTLAGVVVPFGSASATSYPPPQDPLTPISLGLHPLLAIHLPTRLTHLLSHAHSQQKRNPDPKAVLMQADPRKQTATQAAHSL